MTRAFWRPAVIAASLVAVAGCATPEVPDGALLGLWGGPHIELNADETGGHLVYDCAAGEIFAPVTVTDGRLHALGTHTPGHGGPIRVDEVPVHRPARYDAVFSGDRMTLTVTLTDTGERLGVFELTKGKRGTVFACL